MKTVSLKMGKAFQIEKDLEELLSQRAKMKLKLELTELLLKLKRETESANIVLHNYARENGRYDAQGNALIQKYKEGTNELTDIYKEVEEINNKDIEIQCNGITIGLLEDIEVKSDCTELIRFIIENDLKLDGGNGVQHKD